MAPDARAIRRAEDGERDLLRGEELARHFDHGVGGDGVHAPGDFVERD